MSESVAQRLQRLEDKMDEVSAIVYEIRGELKSWKQQVVLIATLVASLITAVINIVVGR